MDMRTQTLVARLLILIAIAAITPAHAQTINQQRSRIVVPVKPAARTSVLVSPPISAVALPRAPDVVGLSLSEAFSALSRVNLSSKLVYVETVDDSVLYNHVGSQIPAAGAAVSDNIVTLQVPRPAARIFAGALSLIDVIRRDGFDLDEGRYEQILRGADMVLREDQTSIPHFEPVNGSTYYTTKGLFVEPSDGTVFALPGAYGVYADQHPGGLGSAPNYSACSQTLSKSRSTYLNLPRADSYGKDLIFCALTSSRQIAVVQFRHSDMTCCGKDNYKFYVAVFPLQKFQGLRARKAVDTPYRPTP